MLFVRLSDYCQVVPTWDLESGTTSTLWKTKAKQSFADTSTGRTYLPDQGNKAARFPNPFFFHICPMCYDVINSLRKELKWARAQKQTPAVLAALEQELTEWEQKVRGKYYVSGFSHPDMPVRTNTQPDRLQIMTWGLIPAWVKDMETAKKMSNSTLNCRIETMFEKPSFKSSAKGKRCIVYADGFFEHHHLKGKTYPFMIRSKDGCALAIAGIWEEWKNPETQEVEKTFSIVTTKGNDTMARIHNNPKLEYGPRMPLLLPDERESLWLNMPIKDRVDEQRLLELGQPYPDNELEYIPVARLKGKEGVGDSAAANEYIHYPELEGLMGFINGGNKDGL